MFIEYSQGFSIYLVVITISKLNPYRVDLHVQMLDNHKYKCASVASLAYIESIDGAFTNHENFQQDPSLPLLQHVGNTSHVMYG